MTSDRIQNLLKTKFVFDSVMTFISTIVMAISGIAINFVLAEEFGPETLGIFNQVLTVYTLIGLFAVFGLQSSLVKHVAEFKEDADVVRQIVWSAIVIVIPISVLFALLFEGLTLVNNDWLFNKEVTDASRYFIWAIPFFTLNKLFLGLFNAYRKMKAYSFLQILRWLAILTIITFSSFILEDTEMVYLAIPYTEVALTVFTLPYIIVNYKPIFAKQSTWRKKHFSFGYKMILQSSLGQINNSLDIFLTGFFLNNYYVGIYSFASNLAKGLLMFANSVQLNFNPVASTLWAENKKQELEAYVHRVGKIMWKVILFVFMIAAVGYPVMTYLLIHSEQFDQSMTVYYILLIGAILPAVYNFAGGTLAMTGFVNISLRVMTIVVLFNVLLAVILIPIFGVYGAALSTSLTYIFAVLLRRFVFLRTLKIKLF